MTAPRTILATRAVAAALFSLSLAACGGQGRAARETHDDQLERGRYLVAIMDCGGCHTPGALLGAPKKELGLSGSDVGFETPAGVVYPPNLTPHPSGLGDWSEAQIIAAVRTGVRPDGRQLVFMPWPAYASMTDSDAAAMAAYLKSLPPIDHKVPGPSTAETAPSPYYSLVDPTKRGR
ncbi:cytochrome c [Caulobacter sp. 17J65-9]|uniref:c-type cytochrome n=1 Tax=Caulobacter sp. 17J65-9 TaxID=2709382 RepID=UPI001969C384